MNKLFYWTTWIIVALSVIPGIIEIGSEGASQPIHFIVGLLLGALLTVAVVWIIRRGGLAPQASTQWFVAAYIWGATVAMFITHALSAPLTSITNGLGWDFVEASFGGAYAEELAKTLGVVVIVLGFRGMTRPWHALVVGMVVGLGFDVFENISYGIQAGDDDPESGIFGLLATWGGRLVLGPGLHAVLTGFAGLGIGYAVFSAGRSLRWRMMAAASGVSFGFCIHFLWNLGWNDQFAQTVMLIILTVIAYGVFLGVWIHQRRAARTDAIAEALDDSGEQSLSGTSRVSL